MFENIRDGPRLGSSSRERGARSSAANIYNSNINNSPDIGPTTTNRYNVKCTGGPAERHTVRS